MDNWKLIDMIKRGSITYHKGDDVVVLRRKLSGYPRGIKDGETYTIREVINDDIVVAQHSSDGTGWLQSIKVHKTYMISKRILRNIKLNSILDETN